MKKIIRNYNRVKTRSKRRGKPNAVEEQPKQSSVLERYPRVFVESVREPSLPLPDEKGSTMEGDGNAEERISDSEFDFLPVAGQMKLSNIQKAQIKRERGKCMEELMSVLARVRLAVDEYNIAEDELKVSESPDPEFEAEEEEKRKRERKIRREQRRALRKIGRQEGGEEKEKGDQDGTQELQTENEDEIESLGSDEESSELSLSMSDEDDEEEENDEPNEEEIKETREEIWAMGGEVKQQISNTMLMRRSKRRRVLKLITSYLELCVEREDIMRQMQLWIESTVDEELMKPARVFLFSPDLLLDDLPLGLTSEMQDFSAALARLKTIADSLGIGVSETADVDESSEKTVKPRAPRKTVYSVDELDNADNWIQAETDVETIIGQAIAAIPVRKIRLNLENAKKQFVLMNQLVARRNVHIRKLEEKGVDLEGELTKTKRHNDELRKTNKKAKVKTEKLQYQNEDLQHNLKEQQKMISELNEKLDEYKRKESYGLYRSSNESMGSLKDSKESMSVVSLVEKPSQQLAPTGEKVMIKTPKSSKVQIVVASDSTESEEAAKPEPSTQTSEESKKEIAELKERLERVEEELKIEKEKSAAFEQEFASLQSDKVKVEQERSELEIQLEDVKRENERAVEELNQNLEDMERENKRLTGEIECNEEMIKYQEERLGQFMEEIQSLEERMMSFPPTPATMSVASMAGGARRERRKTSLQLGLEPQTARQMVAKVKQQYEAELQSLKDHMNKETQRHQAELRRLEQDHKKDVQNIHKEALLLLRALNRFKDSVATLLDREHLSQEAHAIRSHAPLPLDENFGDTRQMLARMAILSNEMLISVELHLSRGLMSKRLEMKDTHLGKMDHPGDALRKSREIGRQKGTMGDLQIQGQQLELHVWRLLEEGRRQDVMERFRDLQTQLSSQEKEVQTIKKTDEEKMKKKEAQLKRVLRRESDVKKTVDEQKSIIKNLASIWKSRRIGQKYIRRDDQLRNLKLLEEAMKEHEVSKELFESTKKMIKDAMDFPRKRFIELVKKYVHFRRVKEIQENVQKMKMESNINERVLLAMQEAEERMVKQKEAWKEKKEQFIKARADILEQLYEILTQVHEETGVLLVKPMDLIPRLEQIKEDVKEINQADILAAANIPKERAKLRKAELLAHAASVAKEQTISGVEGMGITSDVDQGSTWKVMSSFPTAMITTPRLLDMDINRTRHAAQDILARVTQGSLEPKSVSLPPINFFPSLYGYFGKPTAIRKARSEPVQQRKKIVTSLRSRVRFLPPIATLYPEQLEDHNEES